MKKVGDIVELEITRNGKTFDVKAKIIKINGNKFTYRMNDGYTFVVAYKVMN